MQAEIRLSENARQQTCHQGGSGCNSSLAAGSGYNKDRKTGCRFKLVQNSLKLTQKFRTGSVRTGRQGKAKTSSLAAGSGYNKDRKTGCRFKLVQNSLKLTQKFRTGSVRTGRQGKAKTKMIFGLKQRKKGRTNMKYTQSLTAGQTAKTAAESGFQVEKSGKQKETQPACPDASQGLDEHKNDSRKAVVADSSYPYEELLMVLDWQKVPCITGENACPDASQGLDEHKNDSRKAVVADSSYPYEELLMVLDWQKVPCITGEKLNASLPDGFSWIRPDQVLGLRGQWMDLLIRLKLVRPEQAAGIFDGMYNQDSQYFLHHLYGILDPKGKLASVTGIWPGSQFGGQPRIHWMMTSPDYQSRGFGRLTLQKAVSSFYKEACGLPHDKADSIRTNGESVMTPSEKGFLKEDPFLYLSTQAGSWPAIKMYEKNGFVPFEGDSIKTSKQLNAQYWKNARERVFEREGVRI